ncbi:Succinylglutamate desuccinylase / Aspartoacylase family protein [Planctomycetes bacterium Pla163]|uniref:Succinylglutamate desuccinylase / Aspartoacylase family protein n=1 Tax=Rohdeia mirabilis TaxID=2528008 RepID=A0A518CV22_9BACT|nr:Succinylglutamate desuccinylase / Aspartoacylase family protein [Planctomycetes bacterium Pla163]
MVRFLIALLVPLFGLCPTVLAEPLAAQLGRQLTIHAQHIAPDTPYSARVVTIVGPAEGPTVLVVGGVHGDEPAGAMAAEQIAGWTPTRGTLIVVPRANGPALEAGTRRVPRAAAEAGAVDDERDLNRCFPRSDDDRPDGALPAAIWDLVQELEPDYLLDLHEGYHFTQIEPKSVGSSIISDASPASLARAAAMVGELNASIADEKKHFIVKNTAVSGSLARAAHDVLGIPSMILETTTKGQAVAFRARQHRILVATFLTGLGMLDHGPDVLVGTEADPDETLVALYASAGVGGVGPDRLEELLEAAGPDDGRFEVRRVCASDIRAGVLAEFDVVVFPGGSGSAQANSIGADGRDAVRAFVEGGGGYVGICAGAYLAANNYSWSLGILDADVVDREHWARGEGNVDVELTSRGASTLEAESRDLVLRYANGPIFAPARDPNLPDYRVLAWFRGEVEKAGVPGGVMPNTPAIVSGRFGTGRVVCSSPHPEQSAGCEALVRDLVGLAAGAR